MSEDNLTVHILRELREEIRSTNRRLDSMDRRFDSIDRRFDSIDQRFDSMDGRLDGLEAGVATRDQLREVDIRLWTQIAELNASFRDTHDMITANLQLRDRVERCEHDIAGIKDRLG